MKIQEFKRETELFKINENTIGNTYRANASS